MPKHKLRSGKAGSWPRCLPWIARAVQTGKRDQRSADPCGRSGGESDRIKGLPASAERRCAVGHTLAHAPDVIFSANVTNNARQQIAAD